MNTPPPPAWTGKQSTMRSRGKTATVIALYMAKDKVDFSNKLEICRKLGISRWTLDRYLATITEIEQNVQEMLNKLET